MVSSTQTASNTDYGSFIANTSNPAGGIVTNFWSQSGVPDGTGSGSITNSLAQQAFTAGATPNTRFASAPANSETADPRVYGTFSTPLMNEKRELVILPLPVPSGTPDCDQKLVTIPPAGLLVLAINEP